MGQSTPDTTPEDAASRPPRVFLVDVTEQRSYVVRVPETALNLPPGTPEETILATAARAADIMVTNEHPDAVHHDATRTVGDITPLPALN